MKRKRVKKATKAEHAYVRDLERKSAFESVDQGQAQILALEDYPEPLKRFFARERTMVHVKLSESIKRKLETRSRQTGVPVDKLARTWILQGMQRDAV